MAIVALGKIPTVARCNFWVQKGRCVESGQHITFFSFRSVALMLLPALVLLWLGWYVYAKHELNARLAHLRKQGEPLNMKEWYAKAEANFPKKNNPHTNEILEFFFRINRDDFWYNQKESEIKESLLDQNLSTSPILLYSNWDNDLTENATEILLKNSLLLNKLESISSYQPINENEAIIFNRSDTFFTMRLPDLLSCRGMINLLLIKSADEARRGDLEASVGTLECAFRIVDHYDSIPACLITITMDAAMRMMILESVANLINGHPLLEEQYKKLAEHLEFENFPMRTLESITFERMSGNDSYASFHSKNYEKIPGLGILKFPKGMLSLIVLKPYFDLDQVAYLDVMADFMTKMDKFEDSPWDSYARIKNFDSMGAVKNRLFAKIIMPDLSKTPTKVIIPIWVIHKLLLTAIKAKHFQAEMGVYPETLKELTPKYNYDLPKDLFDGKPLRYQKGADGFSLWSVGEDLVDDGGKLDPNNPSMLQRNDDVVIQLQ